LDTNEDHIVYNYIDSGDMLITPLTWFLVVVAVGKKKVPIFEYINSYFLHNVSF
jgi:hypothetical protein